MSKRVYALTLCNLERRSFDDFLISLRELAQDGQIDVCLIGVKMP